LEGAGVKHFSLTSAEDVVGGCREEGRDEGERGEEGDEEKTAVVGREEGDGREEGTKEEEDRRGKMEARKSDGRRGEGEEDGSDDGTPLC
jgi:hypothetical protein